MPFRLNELGGETGEACNLLKKLDREERLQIKGSRCTNDELADEIADVGICLDLVAMGCKLDARRITNNAAVVAAEEGQHLYGLSYLGMILFMRVASAMDAADRTLTVQEVEARFAMAWATLQVVADKRGFNLDIAIANKFNMTSRKNGLTTTLRASE